MAFCFEEGSKCYNFLTCQKAEDIINKDSAKKVSIEVVHNPKKIQHDSDDVNSESDSGVGSVRTTGTEGDSAIESGKESIKKQNVKTITAKVNRVKSVKRSESLLSRFSFIFPQETEKLADILVEEFKKNDQSNGLAMERMFRKADPSALVEASNKKIKKKKSFKQLILGKGDAQPTLPKVEETKETEATSDDVKEIGKSDIVDSSSPDLNMANREKKKRKKRRQQRKPTDEQADDSSSLSSNQDDHVPVRNAPLTNQKTEATGTNQNTGSNQNTGATGTKQGKVTATNQDSGSPSPGVVTATVAKIEKLNK
jgi:hypothetical protein